MANRWGNRGNSDRLYLFLCSKITADVDCSLGFKRRLLLGRKAMTNINHKQHIKKAETLLGQQSLSRQGYDLFSSHVWMWELDYKEIWASKNWCFWIVVLEKTLESHLDSKEIQPVHPQGNQSWIFIGRTDAETETSVLWQPDVKIWLIWKTLLLGRIEGRRKRGQQRIEMVRCHHRHDVPVFEYAPRVGDG